MTVTAPGANWAGNLRYGAARLWRPRTVEQIQEIVASAARIRAIGSRHSFNDLADTTGDLVDVSGVPAEIELDEQASTATVAAGATYAVVAAALDDAGWALHNLASLPHISVAGAVATATHGSGLGNGNLATAVRSLELVGPDGELHRLRAGDAGFDGSVVALGALGVVTRIELAIEPSYLVEQRVWDDVPFAAVLSDVPAVFAAGYSVSMFTDWTGQALQQVWVKSRQGGTAATSMRELGGVAVTVDRHPVRAMSADNCTPQRGRLGPWLERLPHFRPGFVPSSGDELQSEYLVPLGDAAEAIEALRRLGGEIAPLLQVSELRVVRGDRLWLSPSYGVDALAIHFTWHPEPEAVLAATARIERALSRLDARPHWGKLHTVSASRLRELYPRRDDFVGLVRNADPDAKFGNAALARWFPLHP